jgi:hypothetical protein
MNKKFYLSPKFGTLFNKSWITISELLQEASGKNKTSGFSFIQFQEYFLCSFSETQKQQKIGNWHCGDLLIG